MTLNMFWLVNEFLLNEWLNRFFCNYDEMELYPLGDSHISMRPLCLDMQSWPIDYMFSMCLTKCLSWLDMVRSIPWSIFILEAFSMCHLFFGKFHQVLGHDLESSPEKLACGCRIRTEKLGLQSLPCKLMNVTGSLQSYGCSLMRGSLGQWKISLD